MDPTFRCTTRLGSVAVSSVSSIGNRRGEWNQMKYYYLVIRTTDLYNRLLFRQNNAVHLSPCPRLAAPGPFDQEDVLF